MSSAAPRSKSADWDGNADIQPRGTCLKTLLFWGFTLGPQPRQATRFLLGNRLWGVRIAPCAEKPLGRRPASDSGRLLHFDIKMFFEMF